MNDEITEEIRRIRHRLAEQQDNDVSKIFADLMARQATDGRVYVSFPKRTPKMPVLPPLTVPGVNDASISSTESK